MSGMQTKRAVAKAEAAKTVDLAARLAPFFPPPAARLMAAAAERDVVGADS